MPDMNNAPTQVNSEVHVHLNNTLEHVVKEFLGFKGIVVISMDLSLIEKDLQIKIKEKTDGINYRVKSFKTFDQGRFNINTVTNNGGTAVFNTTADHGLVVSETIINRDFTISSYNTPNGVVVSAVPTSTTYELTGISFNADDTGYLVQNEVSNDFKFGQQTVTADTEGSGNDLKLTFQSPVAEGADRDVPLTIRVTTPQ